MAAWIRHLAEDLRERVGITGEPSDDELDRVAEELGAKIVHATVPVPYCVQTRCGPFIVKPYRWRREGDNPYPHELGHAATNPGGGEVIRAVWPGDPKKERLAQLWIRRDEAYAEAFAEALKGGARR